MATVGLSRGPMSQHTHKLFGLLLCLPAAVSAQVVVPPSAKPPVTAQVAAPAGAPAPAAGGIVQPDPIAVDPASKELSAEATALSALRRDTVRTGEELKLLSAQAQIQQEKKKLGQVTAGTADIPELVGIEGTPGRMRAQFLTGKSLIVVVEGGWVTPDWQLQQILSNGVEVAKRGSRTRQTILFGHEPIRGGQEMLQAQSQQNYQQPIAPVTVLPGTAPRMGVN